MLIDISVQQRYKQAGIVRVLLAEKGEIICNTCYKVLTRILFKLNCDESAVLLANNERCTVQKRLENDREPTRHLNSSGLSTSFI